MTCKNQIKDFSQNNIKLFENIEKLCSQLRKIKSKHLLIEIVNLIISKVVKIVISIIFFYKNVFSLTNKG